MRSGKRLDRLCSTLASCGVSSPVLSALKRFAMGTRGDTGVVSTPSFKTPIETGSVFLDPPEFPSRRSDHHLFASPPTPVLFFPTHFPHCLIGLIWQVRSLFADTPGHRNRKPVLESQPGWNPPIGTLRMTTLRHVYKVYTVDGDWPEVPLLPSPHVSVQSVAMDTARRLAMARIHPCAVPSRFRCTVHIIYRSPRCSRGFLRS